jgi:trans-aconitate methyltransferase
LANPYDLVAEAFANARSAAFRERGYVAEFAALAAPGAEILDLGCGTGLPIARYLLEQGFLVTGVDSSEAMLVHARRNCPAARLVHSDMRDLVLPGPYGGLVAWDSVFHVPRDAHARLFREMSRLLAPRAPDEFTAPMFGVAFSYSGHDPDDCRRLLESAGFTVLKAEVDDPSSRGHVAMLCVKAD